MTYSVRNLIYDMLCTNPPQLTTWAGTQKWARKRIWLSNEIHLTFRWLLIVIDYPFHWATSNWVSISKIINCFFHLCLLNIPFFKLLDSLRPFVWVRLRFIPGVKFPPLGTINDNRSISWALTKFSSSRLNFYTIRFQIKNSKLVILDYWIRVVKMNYYLNDFILWLRIDLFSQETKK